MQIAGALLLNLGYGLRVHIFNKFQLVLLCLVRHHSLRALGDQGIGGGSREQGMAGGRVGFHKLA